MQNLRRRIFSPHLALEDVNSWRAHVLSLILGVVVVLGVALAAPNILIAASKGQWPVVIIDLVALAWLVAIWRLPSLSLRARAVNFCALIYLIGLSFLFTVGIVSQIYLMAFPVMAALMLGPRPAMFALALNALSLFGVGYLTDAAVSIARFDDQPLLKWILVASNFTFVNALMTVSSAVLLHGLEKSLEKRRESEELYRATFEQSPIGVARLDMDGRWLQVNQKLCDMTGFRAGELIGRNAQSIAYPGDTHLDDDAIATLLRGEIDSLESEKRYVRRNGHTSWAHVRTSLVRSVDGEPRYLIEASTDITDRKRAENELRIAATAFESQEGMIVTDANSVILRVNQSFIDDTGYSAAEVVGQTPRMLRSGRHDEVFYDAMWETINRTGSWHGEIWNRRKNGDVYPHWLTISAVRASDGQVTHYVGTQIDISHRKAAEDQIHQLAYYDPLTELPNRRLLLNRLDHALAGAARSRHHGAIMFIDLDDFKTLNDTQGHEVGDRLLIEAARRLRVSVRQGDTVARLGGDEFVVMLEDLEVDGPVAARVETVAEKIRTALDEPYQLTPSASACADSGKSGLIEYHCSASIGVTLFGSPDENVDELLKQADLAMYQAKNAGRNAIRFFDPDMQATVAARVALEDDLRGALRHAQFRLHYQPQVVGDGRITGAEALVRWQHPERGMVSPAQFIPLAEETRLIIPLGRWVLETACRQLSLWANDAAMAHLTIAVNVSAHQFHQNNFVDDVVAVLRHTGAPANRLKLELTESLLVSNVEQVIDKMFALRAKDVGFSLDDFGTGYSSLTYLKRLPLDQLKIDQSFVRDVLSDPNDATIAKTIIALGQSLGLSVIAEGVETAAQRDFLHISGCHAYQGYFFARPMPIDDFDTFARGALTEPA